MHALPDCARPQFGQSNSSLAQGVLFIAPLRSKGVLILYPQRARPRHVRLDF